MKSGFIAILLCLGIGVGLGYFDTLRNNKELKNHFGAVSDIDTAIVNIRNPTGVVKGHIEVVGGESLKFGTMRRGSIKRHTFIVKNNGQADAEVWFKASSCKCTVGKFERAKLKPDETTEVELEWRAEGSGDFAQTATLGTDITGQEEIKLTINGQITEAITYDPPSIELGDFLSNSTHEVSGKILNYGDVPMKLTSIKVADDKFNSKFHIAYEPARPPREDELSGLDKIQEIIDFKVSVDKGLSSGAIATQLRFVAEDAPEGSNLVVPTESYPIYRISGRCLNPIRIIAGNKYDEERDILNLGIAPSSEGLKLSFVFGVRTDDFPDAKIALKSISPENAAEYLKVTVGEASSTKNQKLFQVTVEIPPGTAPVEFNGASGKQFVKLTFDTSMQDSPEESIYLKYVIQP